MKTKFKLVLWVLCFIYFEYGTAQNKYVGVWESGNKGNIVHKPLSWNAFVNKDKDMKKQGYRLNDFEIVKKGISVRYTGSWRSNSGKSKLSKALTWQAFLKRGEKLTKNGYRLIDFETFKKAGKRYYVGYWEKGSGNNIITKGLKWQAFLAKGKELTNKGFRLTDFEVFKAGSSYLYVGNWRSGTGTNLIIKGLNWKNFLKKGEELTSKGLRLYDVEIIKVGNKRRYVSAWKNGSGSNLVTKGLKWNDFLKKGEKLTSDGLRLVDFEVFKTNSSTGQNNNPNGIPNPEDFPKVPSYVKLLNGTLGMDKYRVIVDFTRIIDGKPQITIPTQFLKYLPSHNGKIIFPDNFCGLRLIKAERIVWLTKNDGVYNEHPYNYIPESSSILKEYKESGEGEYFYREGIDFTGPIGKCKNSNDGWVFPQPFMKENTVMPQPLKLVIKLGSDSEVKFLNFKIIRGKPLSALKLFKKTSGEKMLKYYEKLFSESLKKWVEAVCKENPEECPLQESEED